MSSTMNPKKSAIPPKMWGIIENEYEPCVRIIEKATNTVSIANILFLSKLGSN